MKNLRQDGIAVMTLSDMVDDFCLAQGNVRESMILAQYRHARWAWKDFFRTTSWIIRKAVLCVDHEKHTIKLPDDCERVINISVVDCFGKLHPLGFNTDWNTAQIKCTKTKCSCNKCHGEEDTLCALIDSIKVVTETVVIRGSNYTKTTLTRYNGAGAVQTQTTIPVWDQPTGTVVYDTLTETICNVETTEKGCIKATRPNMDILRGTCGAGTFANEWHGGGWHWGNYNAYRELIPAPYNYWGEWNYNAEDRQIVHIFGGNRHFGHSQHEEDEWRGNVRQVILEYQTNGETPDTEILIPEYGVECVQIGIVYRQKYLSPRVSEGDKLMAKQAYVAAKLDVVKYLNPVVMENIAKLQTNPRFW